MHTVCCLCTLDYLQGSETQIILSNKEGWEDLINLYHNNTLFTIEIPGSRPRIPNEPRPNQVEVESQDEDPQLLMAD